MSKRPVPVGIVLFCLVLGGVAAGGLLNSIAQFELWSSGYYGSGLGHGLFIAGVYTLLPALALVDIYRRRLSGIYLGLVPLLIIFGFALRLVTAAFANAQVDAYNSVSDVYARMATIGFAISLGTFIFKLGTSKAIAAYFDWTGSGPEPGAESSLD